MVNERARTTHSIYAIYNAHVYTQLLTPLSIVNINKTRKAIMATVRRKGAVHSMCIERKQTKIVDVAFFCPSVISFRAAHCLFAALATAAALQW